MLLGEAFPLLTLRPSKLLVQGWELDRTDRGSREVVCVQSSTEGALDGEVWGSSLDNWLI